MIIWSGRGILIPIFALLGFAFGIFVVQGLAGGVNESTVGPGTALSLWSAVGMLWLFALTIGKPSIEETLDAKTGQPVHIHRSHTFFFLSGRIWAIIASIILVPLGAIALIPWKAPEVEEGPLIASDNPILELVEEPVLPEPPSPVEPDAAQLEETMPEDAGSGSSEVVVETKSQEEPAMEPPVRGKAEPVEMVPEVQTQPAPASLAGEGMVPITLPSEMRTWTDQDGRPLEASLIRFSNEEQTEAEFQRSDRQTFTIPVSRFSAADQELIDRFRTK